VKTECTGTDIWSHCSKPAVWVVLISDKNSWNSNNNILQIDCLTFTRWTNERFFFRGNWIIIHFAVFLVHPVRFTAPFKMAIGDYPAEYNPKVHGPYDPARYYGTPDTPFSQLKLGEVTNLFSIVQPYFSNKPICSMFACDRLNRFD